MSKPFYLIHYIRQPCILGPRLWSRDDGSSEGIIIILDPLRFDIQSIGYIEVVKKYIKENYGGFKQSDYVSIPCIYRVPPETGLTPGDRIMYYVKDMANKVSLSFENCHETVSFFNVCLAMNGDDSEYELRIDIPINLWNKRPISMNNYFKKYTKPAPITTSQTDQP